MAEKIAQPVTQEQLRQREDIPDVYKRALEAAIGEYLDEGDHPDSGSVFPG